MAISKEQPLRPYVQALGDAVDINSVLSAGAVEAFGTVAQMQSATYLTAGMVCHTNGFHSEGDGGAAWYVIGTTGTANGMDVLACAGSLLATLIRDKSKTVRVSQLGAMGGGNDDTSVISRAFAMLEAGDTIVIDVDGCLVTQTLALNVNNVNIIGNRLSYNRLNFSGISGYALEINAHGCKVIGMNFINADAESITDVTASQKCVRIVDLTASDFFNIDFECCDCEFTYFASAITAYGKNANIHDCLFSGCLNGVTFEDNYDNRGTTTQRRGLIVRNCIFHGGDYGIVSGYTIDTINSFPVFGVINTYGSRETVVEGNIFNSSYYGYMYKGPSGGLVLSGNTTESHTGIVGLAYLTRGTGQVDSPCVVQDNVIKCAQSLTATLATLLPLLYPLVTANAVTTLEAVGNSVYHYASFITAINASAVASGNYVLLANYNTDVGLFNLRNATANKSLKAVGNIFDGATGSTSRIKSTTSYTFNLNADYSTLNYENAAHIANS